MTVIITRAKCKCVFHAHSMVLIDHLKVRIIFSHVLTRFLEPLVIALRNTGQRRCVTFFFDLFSLTLSLSLSLTLFWKIMTVIITRAECECVFHALSMVLK